MVARDHVLQRRPFQILHGDERLPMLIVNLVNRADVWVIEGRGSPGLTLEAAQGLRVLCHLVGEGLEDNETIQFDILSLVDDAHPTTAELLDDAVVRNSFYNHGAWPW